MAPGSLLGGGKVGKMFFSSKTGITISSTLGRNVRNDDKNKFRAGGYAKGAKLIVAPLTAPPLISS